ncbi:MAG: hypothetical protein ACOZBZ_03430 [Patescibacteria group bacterium]
MIEKDKDKWVLPLMSKLTEREKREDEMRRAYYDQYQEILNNPDKYRKTEKVVKIGLEMEYSFLQEDLSQAPESARDVIMNELNEGRSDKYKLADVELGAFQMELRTDPIDILGSGVNVLEDELGSRVNLMLAATRKRNLLTISCGTNPFVEIHKIKRSTREKYVLVPNFHNENKRWGLNTIIGTKEQVDVRDAAVVAVCNAMQVNLEAKNFEDAVDKLNRSFIIVPFAMALGGNARFLSNKDTGLSELRMMVWEISHDTRTIEEAEKGAITRIGLPGIYYKDLRDYFQRMAAYPFILYSPENSLAIATGLNWRDVRVKFKDNSAVIEFRPTSMQSTVFENIGMILFYVGRLAWSQKENESLLNLSLIEENRNSVMIHGLWGEMWDFVDNELKKETTRDILARQINRAREGLAWLEIPEEQYEEYLTTLEKRLMTGSLSDQLAEKFYRFQKKGLPRKKSLALALEEIKGLYQ